MLWIQICKDPYNFPGSGLGSVPGCLGSGSISYSNEHNKINWTGKFQSMPFLSPVGPTDKENKVHMYRKYFLGTLPLCNGKDPDSDLHQTAGSGSM